MDEFSQELNRLLVSTYRDVGKLEEGMLHSVSGMEVSIGELHLLEAIGENRERGMLVCELAQRMELTPPTVTVAINKLMYKGYVQKTKSSPEEREGMLRGMQSLNTFFKTALEDLERKDEAKNPSAEAGEERV